ncbi:MAG TPA: PKD domain-containing protein [Methanospirillum sp.]|uniref:PKD domain-containing protein n=1 Tax=Methanospirillum sp. TaxID=45200 RepID=UPI002B812C7B|nr:PKD domain-containing protein [Methanospirillum sp.]HOJ95784.1 PKD domain-containing protein [Methanospirillum sp.]
MAYDIKDVRTAMDPVDNQYHIVLIIILISLIIAAGISVLFTGGQGPGETLNLSGSLVEQDSTGQKEDPAETWIVRILWVDDQNRTYSFQDYPQDTKPDPKSYTFTGDPPPGAQAAMIRFLSWDGSTERTQGARYIMDPDSVTAVLNRYTLMARLSPLPTTTPVTTNTPAPSGTPIPGMLIPESGVVCRNADGSCTARFGYTSRHDHPVSLPVSDMNRFYPGEPDRGQPVVFMPGIHHDVFSVTYPGDATNLVWFLMDKQVSVGTVPRVNTSIMIEPISGYAPLEVRFSERSTGSVPNNPLAGTWNLGDGTITSITGPFYHRYEYPGRYTVSYTVSNACSQARDSGVVTVYQASYTWDTDPKNPATVRFSCTSTGDPSVWFWDFGDGYTSWEQNPVHTYQRAGTYQVGLTISGQHGKGSVVHTISVPS